MGNKSNFYVDLMSLHDEVTGSCHFLVTKFPDGKTTKFVVDCGLFQERAYDQYNKTVPFNADELSFAALTHAHTDHGGRLPLLAHNGFRNKIYMTNLTKEFLKDSLEDSGKIISQVAKRNHTNPLYQESDVGVVLKNSVGCDYNTKIKVDDNISMYMLDNGHIPGAAIILVRISYPGEKTISLLFTGDYSPNSTFFNIKKIPAWVLNIPLIVVQEATYANTKSSDITHVFENNILDAVAKKKTITSTVFSLDRAQKLLLFLKKLQNSGKLDVNIPIGLDGKLAIKHTETYKRNSHLFKPSTRDFIPENFEYITKESRIRILQDSSCRINLMSSGMGTHGPAPLYIAYNISNVNSLIHFTGYATEGTLARRLRDAKQDDVVKIGNVLKQKKCDIQFTSEFSSHANLDEILTFLKQFNNIKMLLINHGSHEAKENLAKEAITLNLAKDVAIERRSTFFRVGPEGLMKELTTKFL